MADLDRLDAVSLVLELVDAEAEMAKQLEHCRGHRFEVVDHLSLQDLVVEVANLGDEIRGSLHRDVREEVGDGLVRDLVLRSLLDLFKQVGRND